jgi:hypothetical protein
MMNFLAIDKVKVTQEGEEVDADSVIRLPTRVDLPLIPEVSRDVNDPFLKLVNASGHHRVVLADPQVIHRCCWTPTPRCGPPCWTSTSHTTSINAAVIHWSSGIPARPLVRSSVT